MPGVKFGIEAAELTDAERGLTPDKHGVMVSSVEEGSFAEDIELEAGDIILAINRHPMGSVDDLRKLAASLKSGDAVAFLVFVRRRSAARAAPARQAGLGFAGCYAGRFGRRSLAGVPIRQAP